MKSVYFRGLIVSATLAIAPVISKASIVATYMPHGPADPPNSAWNQTAYRDIPWWFNDENPYWANNGLNPGPADAYDTAMAFAARLNRNNATGYEAAIINTPNYTHLGTNPYGSPGGAYGTAANNITWGNAVVWNFVLSYSWNAGNPTATMTFTNGATVHVASANLGNRIQDFVNGTGPHLESHRLSDVLFRVATVGTYSATPNYTMNSVTVSNLYLQVGEDAPQSVGHYNGTDLNLQNQWNVQWNWESGADANSNPREIEFLYLKNVLPNHEIDLEIGGEIAFAWSGNAGSISTSGLMFEAKLGQYDVFPDAEIVTVIPEPQVLGCVALSVLGIACRRRRITGKAV